jgi:hypothetical protein
VRILITASRNWEGVYAEARIHTIMNIYLALADALGDKLTIVHGGCPTGGDAIVDRWARRREDDGVIVEVHEASWTSFGRSAGPRRNEFMVNQGADVCLGFLRDNSAGTRNCLALARNAKIPTFVVPWEE